MADREPLGLAAQLRQLRGNLGHSLLGARDDDGRRAVDGRDPHLVGQQRQDLRLGGLDGDHRATGGQRLHQTRARCHEESGLSQGESTRTMRGRYLANRVTHQEVRPHTPRLHKPEQRHLDREQRGLGVLRPVDRVIVGGEHHLAQRTVQVLVQVREHLVQRIREHREDLVQLTAHPDPLAALTGEQERRPALHHRTRHHIRRRLPRHQRGQSTQQLIPLTRDHHRTSSSAARPVANE